MTPNEMILAFDIGGTKVAAGLVDKAGAVHHRREVPTQAAEGKDAILRRICRLGWDVLASARIDPACVRAVAAATGGQVDIESGQLVYATSSLPGWAGLPLAELLSQEFGRPAWIDNDVHSMGAGEWTYGAGNGYRNILCVAIGTGVGGAIISDGQLLHGAKGGAGEIGHILLAPEDGRPCGCGKTGCLEAYASSTAILNDFRTACGTIEAIERLGKPAVRISLQEMAAAYCSSNYRNWTCLHDTVNRAARWLAEGLTSAVVLLNPELIILGGSVQLFGMDYLLQVEEALHALLVPERLLPKLSFALLGADAGLIGAAVLARQNLAS